MLRNSLGKTANLDDLKQIEENLGLYKRNIEDDEHEINIKDKKVSDVTNDIHLLRVEVDKTRNARSDNESSNLNLGVSTVL